MKKWRLFPFILAVLLLFSACKKNGTEDSNDNHSADVKVDFEKTDTDMFTDRDLDASYNENKSVKIQLNGDSVSCSSDSVKISGTTVTITKEGTYILSGTLNDGMIVVSAGNKAKPQLVLNGVSINSNTSAPLYIPEADKVFVTLAKGTTNTLSNGGTFTAIDDNHIDAPIFSKEDLTLNGSGSLTVTSPAGHGIVSKDDLVLTGGTYTIESASHGLDANDSVRIKSASLTIDAGKDGIHAENNDDDSLGFVYISSGSFDISAQGDGISSGAYMQIAGGSFAIVSGGGSANATKKTSDSWGRFGGGRGGFGGPGGFGGFGLPEDSNTSSNDTEDSTSIKGIKANGDMLISSGTFTIDSADDSVHSNSSITVNGGTFDIATGDDGFHADDTLTIAAGTITITQSYEGLEALHVNISGGDIKLTASDDGINAAGGTDASGMGGPRGNDNFGGRGGGNFGGRGDNNNFGSRGGNNDFGRPQGGNNFGGPQGGDPGNSSSSIGTIVISGGTIYVKAYGDGFDANGTLEISGGYITVCGPTQGDTSTLDYDVSGVITGGTFIGTGASGMAQTFSSSEQGVVFLNVGNQSAGTKIILKDGSGKTLFSYEPALSFAVVILSCPEMKKGETYTISIGSSTSQISAN